MSKSTSLLADMTTAITAGPTAATQVLAIAAAGPMMDYIGNCKLVLLKLQEADLLLTRIKTDIDSGDTTVLGLANGIIAALAGTSTPSTALITDAGTIITDGFNATSVGKSLAAAGPIMDMVGNMVLVKNKLTEAKVLLAPILTDTDGSDGSKVQLQSVSDALV